MYLKNLRIQNLRCIGDAHLTFHYPGKDSTRFPNVNLIVGDNGMGKTTVLRAAVLAMLSPILQNAGFAPEYMVRRGEGSASIKADLALEILDFVDPSLKQKSVSMTVKVERIADDEQIVAPQDPDIKFFRGYYTDASPAYFIAAYGAVRRVEGEGDTYRSDASLRPSRRRYRRVEGLFREDTLFVPLHSWLPELERKDFPRFNQIVALVNAVLPDEARLGESVEFCHRGGVVPWPAMSDGYRAFIGWFSDLLYQLNQVCPEGQSLDKLSGVVLVDEIDLYLHPRWQRLVIERVSSALPAIQFIFTTHSPIVAGSVEATNIHVMDVDASGAVTARRVSENVYGLSADQILGSAYFGLSTSRAPGAVDELRDLSRRAGEGDKKAVLDYLERLAGRAPVKAAPRKAASKTTRARRGAG